MRAELGDGIIALALLPGHVTVATLGAGGALPRHVMTLLPCHAVTLLVTVTPPSCPVCSAHCSQSPGSPGRTHTPPSHIPVTSLVSLVSVLGQSEAGITLS